MVDISLQLEVQEIPAHTRRNTHTHIGKRKEKLTMSLNVLYIFYSNCKCIWSTGRQCVAAVLHKHGENFMWLCVIGYTYCIKVCSRKMSLNYITLDSVNSHIMNENQYCNLLRHCNHIMFISKLPDV